MALSQGIPTSLKRSITKTVLDLRKKDISLPVRDSNPRYTSYDEIVRPDGSKLKRKKVILMTGGCSVPTCTMCPFTNENNYSNKHAGPSKLLDQVRDVLVRAPGEPAYDMISLYNDGSFFAPREISDGDRLEIARLVKASQVKVLSVESLPQFLTDERLTAFIGELGETKLEIGIGLQSSNPFVREVCVNTSFNNAEFERAIELMKKLGIDEKIYVLVKPPFLNEDEAISDALASVDYLRQMGVRYATLCPVRVAPHTLVGELHDAGHYQPLNLWSLYEILSNCPREVQMRVACVNLSQDDFVSVTPVACKNCNKRLRDALGSYQSPADLDSLQICTCHSRPNPQKLRFDLNSDDIQTRMRSILKI